jgi:hypothetical protein
MVAQQDTPRQSATEGIRPARRLVLEVGGAPSAEAAEAVLGAWLARGPGRPATVVRVPEGRLAGLVEHLRPRVLRQQPEEAPADFADRLRAALDQGATLVAGGRTLVPGEAEPTLLLNLDPAAPALLAEGPAGPVLAVLRAEDGPVPEPDAAQDVRPLHPDPNPRGN